MRPILAGGRLAPGTETFEYKGNCHMCQQHEQWVVEAIHEEVPGRDNAGRNSDDANYVVALERLRRHRHVYG